MNEEARIKSKFEDIIEVKANIKSEFEDIIELNSKLEGKEKDTLVSTVKEALEYCRSEQEIATHIKEKYDRDYDPNWHCIVGKSFGSNVTFQEHKYAFIRAGPLFILLFKSG